MSHTAGVRQAQKEQTRRALLDAALRLLEHQSLSSLGLREVTREVGVAPAGFYRHFHDMGDLGVVLVEEALGSLHEMIRATLAAENTSEAIQRTVDVIARHVREHPAHIRFIARERHSGVREVREAIAAELDLFVREVAAALGAQPVSAGWRPEDVRMLSALYVDQMLMTAIAFLQATEDGTDVDSRLDELAETARRQLHLVHLGRLHWLDR